MRKFLPLFFLSFLATFLSAQNKDSLLSAFREASLSRDNKKTVDLAHRLGILYEGENENDSVVYYFGICEKRTTNKFDKADAEFHIGRATMFSKPKFSLSYGKEAFAIVKDSVCELRGNCSNLIGILYSLNGKYDSSLYYYTIALNTGEKLKNEKLLVKVKSNLGDLHSYRSEYSKALHYQLEVLDYDERMHDSTAYYRMIINVGNTYNYMGNDSTALVYFSLAYPYYKDKRIRTTANLFNSIARTYDERAGDSTLLQSTRDSYLELERYYLEQSLSIKTELRDSLGIGNTLSNFGRLENQLGNPAAAEKYFIRSMDMAKKINNERLISANCTELGDLYLKQKAYAKAIPWFQLMNELGVKNKDMSSRHDGLNGLYKSYKGLGDYKNAMDYLEQYKDLVNDLHDSDYARQMADAETKYQNKEQQRANEKLTYENQKKTAEGEKATREKKLIMIFSIAALFLLIIIFLLIYRNAKIKAKAEEEKQVTKAVFESEQRERIRISRDLHDNVGTQLSLISNDLEWITHPVKNISEKEKTEKLESLGTASKEVINTLRETIWALNKEEVSFEEFADKLKAHVQKQVKLSKNVKPSFRENLESNVRLGAFEALGLFRISQEAIANSLKYAQAEMLDITLNSSGEKYELVIADNGKGFNPETADKNRYGLANMKFRADEIACDLRIESGADKGTKVIISKK